MLCLLHSMRDEEQCWAGGFRVAERKKRQTVKKEENTPKFNMLLMRRAHVNL